MTLSLTAHTKELSPGFFVRRALPAAARKSVGPFVFFDHFGPVELAPDQAFDVRPHPHIGLATVTYLYEGAIMHRDSLGSAQRIEPGAINWMTAGGGIVHSERTPDELRHVARRMHGLQLWAALPLEHEEDEPAFVHTPAAMIPEFRGNGFRARVLIGAAFGQASPVAVFAPTLYVDLSLEAGASVQLPPAAERAIYPLDAAVTLDGAPVPQNTMLVLDAGTQPLLHAPSAAHIALIGGAPLDGQRIIWWNFVSSSRARIERAKADWQAQSIGQVPGETEFIPLP